ncbi:Z1 domain-containing protein [Halobacillus sp. Cin3]|uniref:Z1 domain-containing protein n=1 Tax=Halobacillus sp. Cin3 TaxID=2928441 RepID=UPI00248F1CFA|nr:Z1 domain-containing protein [Halobacillus sp. Cin3]
MDIKSLFERTFSNNYYNFRDFLNSDNLAAEKALEIANIAIKDHNLSDDVINEWTTKMYIDYNIGVEVPRATILKGENDKNWFSASKLKDAFYWSRYREYLSREKQWDTTAIDSIHTSTNDILSALGNPKSPEPFDKRGLVLGYVQSGKTANFTGLINKAYDVGYKLIIVLSGIHNDLRSQTQLRLNKEVVGYKDDEEYKKVGVSKIAENGPKHIISTWTTTEKDISTATSGLNNLDRPTLIVTKKNGTVLESLRDILINHKNLFNLEVPLLVIDDEADQASVDTSNPKKDEDPKKINKLVRQILEVFKQKSYVGYTATPFANLLINTSAETSAEGKDLYPKDFLIGLPKPKGYCGPEEYFNVYEDADYKKPSLIRILESLDVDVIKGIKSKNDANKFEEVPPQMEEAMLAFLLNIAVRKLRGQKNEHNSMLIHTSRFKDVQSNIKDEVSRAYEAITNQILYNPTSKLIQRLEHLYNADLLKTSLRWSENSTQFSWQLVFSEVKQILTTIQIVEINGNSKDALDYDEYKENGLNVIAIGGDKLSRGLTLEGLSITYYARNTLMYDTLMQMGRWFGFREGYIDLCRIYTTEEIAFNFEHLAYAMVELRKEFDKMDPNHNTPMDYAVKMLAHPTMTLTNPLKMRNAIVTNILYGGTLQQTRIFEDRMSFFEGNMKATTNLINNIHGSIKKQSHGTGKVKYYIAEDIDVKEIKEFLNDYKTDKNANKVNSDKILNYINLANKYDELVNWTVAIVEGLPQSTGDLKTFPVKLGSINLDSAVRRGTSDKGVEKLDVGAIVASKQEFVDIDYLKQKGISSKGELRKLRPKEYGMLLIYPLHPGAATFSKSKCTFSEDLVPIGVAVSFPNSDIEVSEVYQTNKTVR